VGILCGLAELLKGLQTDSRHNLDTFADRIIGSWLTGCPTCRKTFYTVSNFIDHFNHDVSPNLIDGLSSDSAAPPKEGYIDVDDWADPDRNLRRKSGEQDDSERD
jgi:hypothetical protein